MEDKPDFKFDTQEVLEYRPMTTISIEKIIHRILKQKALDSDMTIGDVVKMLVEDFL